MKEERGQESTHGRVWVWVEALSLSSCSSLFSGVVFTLSAAKVKTFPPEDPAEVGRRPEPGSSGRRMSRVGKA